MEEKEGKNSIYCQKKKNSIRTKEREKIPLLSKKGKKFIRAKNEEKFH